MAEDPDDGMVELTWSANQRSVGPPWPQPVSLTSTCELVRNFSMGPRLQGASIAPSSSVYCLAGQGVSTPIFLARFSSSESLKL
jgi:hypothetical protein